MNINVVTMVDDSGYGVVGFHILEQLDALGHDVVFFPRQGGPARDFDRPISEVACIVRFARRQPDMDMNAPCLRITYEGDMTMFAGRGPRCGLSFFETTKFTERELRHLHSLDLLFVASQWGKGVAIENGIDAAAIALAPMGVSRTTFHESPMPEGSRTVFVNIGKWERRKGQDVLVEAFGRAFAPSDDVELRLLCHNPWSPMTSERWVETCRHSPMAEHITVLPRVGSQQAVADVLRDADCAVFTSRAEGWNLEALEALSCGRHVIATDYSGHTEFLDHENALLVAVDTLEPASDPVWQPIYRERKVGDWAALGETEIEQVVSHLRAVHERKQHGELDINHAGIATATRLTWENTARHIVAGLERL
jgi:glycosyltransferase involved in cell wall biosynthesis